MVSYFCRSKVRRKGEHPCVLGRLLHLRSCSASNSIITPIRRELSAEHLAPQDAQRGTQVTLLDGPATFVIAPDHFVPEISSSRVANNAQSSSHWRCESARMTRARAARRASTCPLAPLKPCCRSRPRALTAVQPAASPVPDGRTLTRSLPPRAGAAAPRRRPVTGRIAVFQQAVPPFMEFIVDRRHSALPPGVTAPTIA